MIKFFFLLNLYGQNMQSDSMSVFVHICNIKSNLYSLIQKQHTKQIINNLIGH